MSLKNCFFGIVKDQLVGNFECGNKTLDVQCVQCVQCKRLSMFRSSTSTTS